MVVVYSGKVYVDGVVVGTVSEVESAPRRYVLG